MIKTKRLAITKFIPLLMTTIISSIALANVTPSQLARNSLNEKCLYSASDLNKILTNNLCSQLTKASDIAHCAKAAVFQYSICSYSEATPISNNPANPFGSAPHSSPTRQSSVPSQQDENAYSSSSTNGYFNEKNSAPKNNNAFNWF